MVLVHKIVATAQDFDTFVNLPENVDKRFELIAGEIAEVPSNPRSSEIAIIIASLLRTYVKANDLGHVTGEAGGYMIGENRIAPDVAFISKVRQAKLPYEQGYNPLPPDLAIEVISPSDNLRTFLNKVGDYLAANVVVWVVYPVEKEVVIYALGQKPQTFDINATLQGGELLPGFTLPVKQIFED